MTLAINGRFLTQSIRRYHQCDRLADGLGRRITKKPFRPVIPRLDDAVQIFTDNRVVGRGDNRRKVCAGGFSPLLGGHISCETTRMHKFAIFNERIC